MPDILSPFITHKPIPVAVVSDFSDLASSVGWRQFPSICEHHYFSFVLSESRKNAASVAPQHAPHDLLMLAQRADQRFAEKPTPPIPLGYHFILEPRMDEEPIKWVYGNADFRDVCIYLASHIGNVIRHRFWQDGVYGVNPGWGLTIAMNDGNSARREHIHAHIILTPPKAELEAMGLDLQPMVLPRIVPKID